MWFSSLEVWRAGALTARTVQGLHLDRLVLLCSRTAVITFISAFVLLLAFLQGYRGALTLTRLDYT